MIRACHLAVALVILLVAAALRLTVTRAGEWQVTAQTFERAGLTGMFIMPNEYQLWIPLMPLVILVFALIANGFALRTGRSTDGGAMTWITLVVAALGFTAMWTKVGNDLPEDAWAQALTRAEGPPVTARMVLTREGPARPAAVLGAQTLSVPRATCLHMYGTDYTPAGQLDEVHVSVTLDGFSDADARRVRDFQRLLTDTRNLDCPAQPLTPEERAALDGPDGAS